MAMSVSEIGKYMCPVCGYPELEEPPERFSICPSCGTEFGDDDFVFDPRDYPKKLVELRSRWLDSGAPWFDELTQRPPNWRPYEQVVTPGVGLTLTTSSTSTDARSRFWDLTTLMRPRPYIVPLVGVRSLA
jgi:hypothetical protein